LPFTTSSDGVCIHYAVTGSGPPLVLSHWFAGSLEDWREFGYVEALRTDYRLVLVDARGHGRSDKPHDPAAHTTDQYARDIVAVLDELGIETAHYWGYSNGGFVGFAAALLAPERFRSFVIGGADPWWTPEWSTFADELIGILGQGMERMVTWSEEWLGPWPEPLRARTLANDPQALIARFTNIHIDPGYRERLGEIRHPTMLYRAEADEQAEFIVQTAGAMPNACVSELPGLNHLTALTNRDRVLSIVLPFLKTQDAANGGYQ